MNTTVRRGAVVVLLVLFAACGSSGPTSPSETRQPPSLPPPTPRQPPPPGAPVWNWDLTTVLTAVTGPDNCFKQQQVRGGIPRSIAWQLEVTRAGNAVTFDYDVRNYPSDNVRQTGTVDGNEFTARSVPWPISFPSCADGTVLSGSFDASVTGRFSDDGTHLTAKELWSYHFSSGEITFFIEWSADER